MFKNLKLSFKISGLALILILFGALVNITGYSALSGVSTASKTLESLNSISKLILEARRHEKNYILRKNPAYIQKVKKVTQDMLGLNQELTTQATKSSQLSSYLPQIKTGINKYWDFFAQYATLDKNKEKTLDTISKSKNLFSKIVYSQLETTIKNTEFGALQITKIARTFDKMDAKATNYITLSQRDNFDKNFNQQDILKTISELILSLEKHIRTLESSNPEISKLTPVLKNYHTSLTTFNKLNNEQQIINKKMVMAGRTAQSSCNSAQANQTKILTNTIKHANLIMLGVMLLASLAGAVMSYFLITGITKPIKNIIDDINKGSQQTTQAANEVSVSSQQLSQGATEQAASLEETSSSLDEITSMVSQNADHAQNAQTLSQHAKQDALSGNSSMADMTDAMTAIKSSSDEISTIIKSIEEIAFQTNLLALNAAVEAARAGEHGKGFAVVAQEVRNLAKRSADAAKNTANLIDSSIAKVNQGNVKTKEVATTLQSIQNNVVKTADIVQEIASANKEQADGICQINKAITQMDTITQTTAASAEESASVAEELSAQAQSLSCSVKELQILIDGPKALQYMSA